MRLKTSFSASLIATVLASAVNAGLPDRAQALELFGVCLIKPCEPDEDAAFTFIDPRTYDVEFVVETDGNVEVDELESAVKNASALYQGREKPVAGAAGLIARAKGDYRRILASLYQVGHYDVSISILVEGREAADLPVGTTLPERSNITVQVGPGQPYTFGNLVIENAAERLSDPDDRVRSLSDIGFAEGGRARAARVKLAGQAETEAWREIGYPKAKVGEQQATAIHPQKVLNVRLRMEPGPKAGFGEVTVQGTQRMDPAFVAYMAGVEPGKEFDPDEIERVQKRLDRLGVFSSRKIEEGEVVNGLMPLHILVSEKKLRRIGVGATFSSVDGAGLEAFWLHRNLFGKAERLRFDAKVGGATSSADVDVLDYLLGVTFTQPGIFTPDTDLVWNTKAERTFNETFVERSARASVGLTNYLTPNVTLNGGLFAEHSEFEDAFGKRTFTSAGFTGDVTYDSRDNALDATRGFYAQFAATPYYEWEFDNAAVQLQAEARTYLGFGKRDRTVLAARVKTGLLTGSEIDETPADRLFLTGGGNSVRGFAFKSVGVDGPNGETVGGRSLLEGSVELRQRIGGSFGAVAFVDAGVVGRDELGRFSDDVRVGAGLGLRYFTGLGPIRLDVAFPLNPGPNDDDFAIYAGIGQAF